MESNSLQHAKYIEVNKASQVAYSSTADYLRQIISCIENEKLSVEEILEGLKDHLLHCEQESILSEAKQIIVCRQ